MTEGRGMTEGKEDDRGGREDDRGGKKMTEMVRR